jgi:hypothetical protein
MVSHGFHRRDSRTSCGSMVQSNRYEVGHGHCTKQDKGVGALAHSGRDLHQTLCLFGNVKTMCLHSLLIDMGDKNENLKHPR